MPPLARNHTGVSALRQIPVGALAHDALLVRLARRLISSGTLWLSERMTVVDALNKQVGQELQSAYVYLAMSAHCEAENLPGFASWLRVQAQEELGHAMRFYDFILDRGSRVELGPIEAPRTEFPSLVQLFQEALDNERAVTRSIYELYELAHKERDYGAHTLLEEFAAEQVEEEKTVSYVVETLKRVGDDGTGLFVLDRELATRGSEKPKA